MIMKNFSKSDLKTGMRVRYRNGGIRLVLRDTPLGELVVLDKPDHNGISTHNNLNVGYTNDLRCRSDENAADLDIVAVYKPTLVYKILDLRHEGDLIWERKEPKRLTLEELEARLGFEVEIIEELD